MRVDMGVHTSRQGSQVASHSNLTADPRCTHTPLTHIIFHPCRTFTALAASDELRLDWKLQPGDIPLLNNLTMLHAKSAFRVGASV